jgi:predicted nuclease of predicted toxin-antitoxin system
MKLKLDENLGGTAFRYLVDTGCNVSTVPLQNLCGSADRNLIDVCASEGRCLVTLDLDFSNPLQFPPEKCAGIVVLRLPKQPSGEDIIDCLKTLTTAVPIGADLSGSLRIVSRGRVREYGRER